jgi:hypothetical protein
MNRFAVRPRLTACCLVATLLAPSPAQSDEPPAVALHLVSLRAAAAAIEQFQTAGNTDALQACLLILELPENLTVGELKAEQERAGRIEFRLMNSAEEREAVRSQQLEATFGKYGGRVLYAPKGSITEFKWDITFRGELAMIYVNGLELLPVAEKISREHPELVRIVADVPTAKLQPNPEVRWPACFILPEFDEDSWPRIAELPGVQRIPDQPQTTVLCWTPAAHSALLALAGDQLKPVNTLQPAPRRCYRWTGTLAAPAELLPRLNPAFPLSLSRDGGLLFFATDEEFAALDKSVRELSVIVKDEFSQR